MSDIDKIAAEAAREIHFNRTRLTDLGTSIIESAIEKATEEWRRCAKVRMDEIFRLDASLAKLRAAHASEQDDTKRRFNRLREILKERSKGEYDTWGFVSMFMEMIDPS